MNPYSRRFTRSLAFFMLAKDGGESGGGGKPPTLEEQLAQARVDLTAAQASVTAITGERDAARTGRDTLQAEVTQLTSQFAELTKTANQAKADLATAQASLASVTGERDTARTQLTTAGANVTRLEALCGVKGIDPNAAVPHATQPGAAPSVEDLDAEMKAAKTPEARAAVAAKAQKALAPKPAA